MQSTPLPVTPIQMIDVARQYSEGILDREGFPQLVRISAEPWDKGKHIRNPLRKPDQLLVPYGQPHPDEKGAMVVLVAEFQLGEKRQHQTKEEKR